MTTVIQAKQPQHALPFIEGNDYWTAMPSGDWASDTVRGRELAKLTIGYLKQTGNTPMLNHILRAMMDKAILPTGLEIGFVQQVAEMATDGLT